MRTRQEGDCHCGNCFDCRWDLLDQLYDCSEEAQEERRAQMRDIRGKLITGVQSISDRSRSISYSLTYLQGQLGDLENMWIACEYGPGALQFGRRRIWVPVYTGKNL